MKHSPSSPSGNCRRAASCQSQASGTPANCRRRRRRRVSRVPGRSERHRPTFAGGTFSTRTTDTNQLLASGNYVNVSPTLVEINMTSLVRNTQSKVNCALATPAQLNCTTDSGAQFSLARRG